MDFFLAGIYLCDGDGLPGEHALVHDAGSAEQEDVTGHRVLCQGAAHRDNVPRDQLVGGEGAPSLTSVHLATSVTLTLITAINC